MSLLSANILNRLLHQPESFRASTASFPHCDDLVLHAPYECKYCDMFPDMQALRLLRGIPFTGHGEDPATERRPLNVINKWAGNRKAIV